MMTENVIANFSVMVSHLSEKEIFTRAAELIKTKGLAKGVFISHDGCFCIAGALVRANEGKAKGLANWLGLVERKLGVQSAINWSDAPGTTKEQVVEVLLAVASSLPDKSN